MPELTHPSILGLVSYQVFPAQMGGQKCVTGFYEHLAKKTRVILAIAKENKVQSYQNLQVYPFLYNHWWAFLNLAFIYRLIRLMKTKNIDILLIEHSYFGWIGLLLRSISKKPFVIRSHNIEALRFRDLQKGWWRLYEWYEKKIHKKADHSFFISEEDKDYSIQYWQLDNDKCSLATYGTDLLQPIPYPEKISSREKLLKKYQLLPDTRMFLFTGSLDYLPNLDALRIIIKELLPLLQNRPFDFRIYICGKGLSEQWKAELANYPAIIYTGFVDNIEEFLSGSDCFINPVTLGGGIKTKLIDALAHNLTTISTESGASNMIQKAAAQKLMVVEDYDWKAFAEKMTVTRMDPAVNTPLAFYTEFNWDCIAQKALATLQNHE